mgnify:FL=1
MRTLELQVFGAGQEYLSVGHGAIGGILHRLWQLPDAVVKAAGVHQSAQYEGDEATYVHMVQLANELLKKKGIGDEFNPADSAPLLETLGYSQSDADSFIASVDAVADDLDALARSLSA